MLFTKLQPYLPFEELAYVQLFSLDEKIQALALWIRLGLLYGHTALKIEKDCIYPALSELHDTIPKELEYDLESYAKEALTYSELPFSFSGPFITLPSIAEAEKKCVAHLKRLQAASLQPFVECIDDTLNAEQLLAVKTALKENITLIAGGPGTGKTYTVGRFLSSYKDAKVILTAPTGKAACHLEKSLKQVFFSYEVKTLHALVQRNEPIDAHVVIVDECSMIDLLLFEAFLAKVPRGTKLILLGDPDQLAAIGSGAPFAALLHSSLPKATLSSCVRTSSQAVMELASTLRLNDPSFFSILKESSDIGWYDLDELTVKKRVESAYEGTTMVLSPVRHGPFGVASLNDFIRPISSVEPILITKNDWQLGVTNGEVGLKEKRICFGKARDYFVQPARQIPLSLLPSYEPAYALSIHKSQGSEADRVLVVLPEGSERFGWRLLYTAITRAKKRVEIFSSYEVLLKAFSNRQATFSTEALRTLQ